MTITTIPTGTASLLRLTSVTPVTDLLERNDVSPGWLAGWLGHPGQRAVAVRLHGDDGPTAAGALLRVRPEAYADLRAGGTPDPTMASPDSDHWWLAGPWTTPRPEAAATSTVVAELLERWVHERTDRDPRPAFLLAPARTELDTVLGWGHDPVYLPRLVRMIPVLYGARAVVG